MVLYTVFYFFIFIFGLCVGSFLNVVIYRTEQESSFFKGRSFCPACKHKLIWKDLFPVFSFLFLRGSCRYCKNKISIQYPLVELFTGFLFVLIFWKLGFASDLVSLLFWFYIASVLIIIFIYDLKHYLIPDSVLFPAIIISFLFQISNFKFQIFIQNYLLAVVIAAGFFFIIWLISGGRWMGFGDVKLAILLGLILGYPDILAGLFLSFFVGAIIGVILMLFVKKDAKSEVPFGPFLISGTLAALFWGQNIINWYLGLVL